MRRVAFFGSFVTALLAGAVASQAQTGSPLPEGDGRSLVATACTQCHALAPIIAGREGAPGWRRHVHNMILRGAQLNAAEAETVVQYLAANFGPGIRLPTPTPVTLPDGTGKDLVETRCVVCHDLERVAGVKRLKRDWPMIVDNMVTRGAPATSEEARAIAAYLVAYFGVD